MAGYSTGTWSAKKIVALSASASVIPTCRALNVGTAGTADITDADGNDVAGYILSAGYNPVQIKRLTALGTAANIWALY